MQISPTELSRKPKDSYYLLDVRNQNEQEICVIPGTDYIIPVKELSSRLNEIDTWKDRDIIIYCRGGIRSARACKLLIENGFSNVLNLKGGILQYIGEVDPSLPVY